MPPVKRRYILFRLDFFNQSSSTTTTSKTLKTTKKTANHPLINEGDIIHSIRDMVQKLYGDFGLGSILLNFHAKKYDPITRTGVLAIKRESYKFLITALPLIKTIKNYSISFQIIKISGTIRGTLRSLQGYHGRQIHNYRKILNNKSSNNENNETIIKSLINN